MATQTTTGLKEEASIQQNEVEDQPPTRKNSKSQDKKQNKKRSPRLCRATVNSPEWYLLLNGEPLAFDAEFQRCLKNPSIHSDATGKWAHRLGRVAVVNTSGQVILDCYAVYKRENGIRKQIDKGFSIEWDGLLFEKGAVALEKVERWLKEIFRGRPVVVHDPRGDSAAFYIEKDVKGTTDWRDTQAACSDLEPGRTRPGLRKCAERILGKVIQVGEHSPVEYAHMTMEFWLRKFPYDRVAEAEKLKGKGKQISQKQCRSKKELKKMATVAATPEPRKSNKSVEASKAFWSNLTR